MNREDCLRPVRCVLEVIPTRRERIKRALSAALTVVLMTAYLLTTGFLAFNNIIDRITAHRAQLQMDKDINDGKFVYKKGAKKR